MSEPEICRYSVEDEEFCWNVFVNWCEDNGVGLEYKEDWVTWWNCWCDGIVAYQQQSD
jgi:hypothetical protein